MTKTLNRAFGLAIGGRLAAKTSGSCCEESCEDYGAAGMSEGAPALPVGHIPILQRSSNQSLGGGFEYYGQ